MSWHLFVFQRIFLKWGERTEFKPYCYPKFFSGEGNEASSQRNVFRRFFFQMRPTKWVDILLISSFFSGEANKVSSNLNISKGCFTVRWANWIHTLLYSKVFLRQGEQSEFSPFCFPKVFVRWGEQSEFTPYCFPKVSLRWGERSDLTPYCFPKIFSGQANAVILNLNVF